MAYTTQFSEKRILTTHAGALPRPDNLKPLIAARAAGKKLNEKELDKVLKASIKSVVKKQTNCGLDSVNDGEFNKVNFTLYGRERLEGYEIREKPSKKFAQLNMVARDYPRFGAYFDGRRLAMTSDTPVCVGPVRYVGQEFIQADVDTFKASLKDVDVAEAFLPANTPGTIEHWMRNDYYKTDEEFVFAIAEAMRVEYEAIANAGFVLQIDDPDLPDGWACLPGLTVAQYRKYATMRVDALNYALRNVPREQIRLHVCWGSFHGPHSDDIPLKDIVDIIFRVKASSYSIEASNPTHEHEWQLFETVKLPKNATLVPGVVGHCTDFIEHPDLIAQRLVRYAKLVGRENVLAGTDCGIGPRVGHPEICWAKFEAMAEGARRATKQLWSKPKRK
jgi:5-methyltetrahydropteroyltriglutamate--homocysteine methyltransferase